MQRRLVSLAVAFGIACRVRQYAANTSLWHDESFVALNVVHVPYAQLLGPLDWHEPSPPGFLAAEKVMTAALGTSEYALRALPLVAGVAALIAFARLARSACVDAAALWAVLLLAASPKLIADASATKHFSLDLLLAVVITGLAWQLHRAAHPRSRRLLAWGAVGSGGLWFSYAAAFGFAGTSLALAVPAARWPRLGRRAYLFANLLAAASAAALLGAIRAQRSSAVLQFWTGAFPDTAGALAATVWLGRALVALFDYFWQPFGGVLLLLALLAAAAVWRSDRRPLLAILWLPVGLALAASPLHWWPFGGNQHMVFAAPAVLLLVGEGIEIARHRLEPRHPRLTRCALAVLLAPGLLGALHHLVVPQQRHEMRPVIAFMQARLDPGDQLAVFDPATFEFYTGRDLRGALPAFDAGRRVWVITPRGMDGSLHPDVRAFVDSLSRARPRVTMLEVHGAAAYLFGTAVDPVSQP